MASNTYKIFQTKTVQQKQYYLARSVTYKVSLDAVRKAKHCALSALILMQMVHVWGAPNQALWGRLDEGPSFEASQLHLLLCN